MVEGPANRGRQRGITLARTAPPLWERAMLTGPLLFPELADENGLVAVGGDLRPDRLLTAYRRGVFPWYDDSTPILWWSPDPRAIFEIGGMHVSRSLRRTIRAGGITLTINRDFAGVLRGCADRPGDGNWITTEMLAAYETLHRMGHAHSVEAWRDGVLAGGIYGVAIGGFFAGESMFSRVRDASKVALAFLMDHLQGQGFRLFDIQFLNPHTERLGAIEISREEYLKRLSEALRTPVTFLPT
jgi:leucyl/phenylalanyl-tRNA--protein transferase